MRLAKRTALSLILALAIDWWLTIEWSWPSCGRGDAWLAVYGLPLPYVRWGGASSMEYAWVPELFALNMALLGGLFFVVIGHPPAFRHSRWFYRALGVVAVLSAMLNALMLSATIVASRDTLSHEESGETMGSLRPVALRFAGYRRYECTRAPWWFGAGPATSGFPARPEPPTRFP